MQQILRLIELGVNLDNLVCITTKGLESDKGPNFASDTPGDGDVLNLEPPGYITGKSDTKKFHLIIHLQRVMFREVGLW